MKEMIQSYTEPKLGWRQVVSFLGVLLFNATCNLKAKNTPVCKPQTQTFFFSYSPKHFIQIRSCDFQRHRISSQTSVFCFKVITSLSNLLFLFKEVSKNMSLYWIKLITFK